MKKKISTSIIFAFLFLFSIPYVIGSLPPEAVIGSDNIYVENENIAIAVTGGQNVPMYSFWNLSNPENNYSVKFILIYEVIDVDKNGEYNPEEDTQVPLSTRALPAMSWNFSEIVTDEDDIVHFNITSQGAAFIIQFRNHIGTDASLKFDIVIENYVFVSDSEDVMLIFGFLLQTGEAEEAEQTGERIDFGENGYFETEPMAEASGESINVGLTMGDEEGEPLAYIAFARFEGTLVHDPTLGIVTSIYGDDSNGDDTTPVIPGPNISLLLTVVAITAMIGAHRFKRKST